MQQHWQTNVILKLDSNREATNRQYQHSLKPKEGIWAMVMQSHPHDIPLEEEVGGPNRDARSHVRDTANMWKKVLRKKVHKLNFLA